MPVKGGYDFSAKSSEAPPWVVVRVANNCSLQSLKSLRSEGDGRGGGRDISFNRYFNSFLGEQTKLKIKNLRRQTRSRELSEIKNVSKTD
jgi:hypothetical protein